jgi:uncharacterized protein with GYD domain
VDARRCPDAFAARAHAGTPTMRDLWQNASHRHSPQEDSMPTFIMSLSWTEQGIRSIKDWPKRGEAARELAKKTGVEVKHVYVTTGDSDLVVILEAANDDNVAKFAMAQGALGFVRTRTARAWTEEEAQKLISGLP